jgi:hypothetical protein
MRVKLHGKDGLFGALSGLSGHDRAVRLNRTAYCHKKFFTMNQSVAGQPIRCSTDLDR